MAGPDGWTRTRRTTACWQPISADCFVESGVTGENYVQVFKDVAAAKPDIKLYGPDGVAEGVQRRTRSRSIACAPRSRWPPWVLAEFKAQNQEAEKFFADFRRNSDPSPDPYAIYGYETMALALATLNAVGDKASRKAASQQLLNTKGRESVLGTYDITAGKDTTSPTTRLYDIKDGCPSSTSHRPASS